MAPDLANRAVNGNTITALSRWSILDKKLPPIDRISTIHVYDFDNTLFQTPLPNPKLWNASTIGQLGRPDIFINGGWWHDSRILAATGEGVEHEEKRAWEGWWNEKIVELVRLSMQQEDALCVLLTGRSEQGFSQLIKRIVASKGLEFHMMGLKPFVGPNGETFANTMDFKQVFIRALLSTYRGTKEIRIYEDRPRHVEGFRDFLADHNKQRVSQRRNPLVAEVIPVAELSATLDPVVEVAEVQHLINVHNALVQEQGNRGKRMAIKKTVYFTSYMVESADSARLVSTLQTMVSDLVDMKYLANTILITPRPCPKNILDKIGGMGSKMMWEAVDIGSFQNNLWAARVRPVPANAQYHTDNPSPAVVLGLRRGARPPEVNRIRNWQPIPLDKTFMFETTVGEKVMLRIETERQEKETDEYEDRRDGVYQSKVNNKRKYYKEDDRQPRQSNGNFGNSGRDYHNPTHQGRGGADNRGRGGYRGGGAPRGGRGGGSRGNFKGPGRGGKGVHGYRSLDDVDRRDSNQGGFGPSAVSYDDSFPNLSSGGPPPPSQYPLPPPPTYGQPFPQQQTQWQAPGNTSTQSRPMGAPGPDLQNYY
ncbi:uncharacterized protein GGS25DRAFT_526421 [Hypoxylon fragiforme]|uniref:uncharacterized protein n=1 Tax=Hypoxylon fragiforme TaxID=63214 RepID=UPI0020C6C973|nr:uncharacterized protein GGS25DRAFT_526421 [Hypoxylon fragiforme]KAI2603382.1 hypothetical protein GGS25DRAFT_526421 [Hypoxylon fragiforme]